MSAPTLSQFTAELRNRNISRPNLYYIEMVMPPLLMNNRGKSELDLVSMWCHTAMTPQTTILTKDDHTEAGTRRKYAYDQDYQNLTLSFYIDQDFKVKEFFDQWKSIIVPQKRNFGYPNDYTADTLNLYIINQEDKATYKYEYSRIFPKSIGSVDLSYASGNTLSTFAVDFVFEEFTATSLSGIEVVNSTSKISSMIKDQQAGIGITNPEVLAASTIPSNIQNIISGMGGDFGGGGATGSWG